MAENCIRTMMGSPGGPGRPRGSGEVRRLAERLARAHGVMVKLTRERSGYHIYLPCPECLKTHGEREELDPKYSINASKYCGLGDDFRHLAVAEPSGRFDPLAAGAEEVRDVFSGVCMRTYQGRRPHRFPVRDLLLMSPVGERHPELRLRARPSVVGGVGSGDVASHWEVDPVSGVLCPPPPGVLVPVTELPADHPAVGYLVARGFDPGRLWEQFRCSFCVKEYPHGSNGVYYRRMPGGWRDTPQGRVVFHALRGGVPVSWQARLVEVVLRGAGGSEERHVLHPEAEGAVYPCEGGGAAGRGHPGLSGWSLVATRVSPAHPWVPVSPFDGVDGSGRRLWDPSKYRTAKYSTRELMGWDAAVARAAADPAGLRWCVLNEGPLDAARWGPGGLAVLGKSISPDNAARVAGEFQVVFTAFDNDRAGREATEAVRRAVLTSRCRAPVVLDVVPLAVPGGKDPGELEQEVADRVLAAAVRRALR